MRDEGVEPERFGGARGRGKTEDGQQQRGQRELDAAQARPQVEIDAEVGRAGAVAFHRRARFPIGVDEGADERKQDEQPGHADRCAQVCRQWPLPPDAQAFQGTLSFDAPVTRAAGVEGKSTIPGIVEVFEKRLLNPPTDTRDNFIAWGKARGEDPVPAHSVAPIRNAVEAYAVFRPRTSTEGSYRYGAALAPRLMRACQCRVHRRWR